MNACLPSPWLRGAAIVRTLCRKAGDTWRRWRQRARTRGDLRALGASDLCALIDIGLDPLTAEAEARKFFWQS
jgi:uncharacterized protein YjiS (DUF1127 family)